MCYPMSSSLWLELSLSTLVEAHLWILLRDNGQYHFQTNLLILGQEYFPDHCYTPRISSKRQLHWNSCNNIHSFHCVSCFANMELISLSSPYPTVYWYVFSPGKLALQKKCFKPWSPNKFSWVYNNGFGLSQMKQSSHFLILTDLSPFYPQAFTEYTHWILLEVLRSWSFTILPCGLSTLSFPGILAWGPQAPKEVHREKWSLGDLASEPGWGEGEITFSFH